MNPFHVVYRLEFRKGHIRIQKFEFGRRSVLCKLRFPIFRVHRWQGTGHWPPFGNAEPALCQRYSWPPRSQRRSETNPDSVSLVRPPNTTIPKTLVALPSSQYATTFSLVSGNWALRPTVPALTGFDSDAKDADFSIVVGP